MAIQKLLSLLLLLTLGIIPKGTSGLCTPTIEPNRLTSSCAFNPLLLVTPHTGWVLSKENCGEVIALEAFSVPPVLYYDNADEERLYTLAFLEFGHHGHHCLRWLVANVSGALLLQGMTYMDGDTAMDYQPPVPRSSTVDDDDDDDDDVDGQPTRYGFYLYEQVYGTIYPPVPRTGARSSEDPDPFDLDVWIASISADGALCGPVASIGFGARDRAHAA